MCDFLLPIKRSVCFSFLFTWEFKERQYADPQLEVTFIGRTKSLFIDTTACKLMRYEEYFTEVL